MLLEVLRKNTHVSARFSVLAAFLRNPFSTQGADMLKFPLPLFASLLMAGSLAAADVVVVEGGVTTIVGIDPPTAPAIDQVVIGGGQVRLGQTGKASGDQAVRGDDPRLLPYQWGAETDFSGTKPELDLIYTTTTNLTSMVTIPGTNPNFPFLRTIGAASTYYWMVEGPLFSFSAEGPANEITYSFQCLLSTNWTSDDKPEVDFGFHDGIATSGTRPSNGAYFTRGATNTTIVAYTANNGSLAANAVQFTPVAGVLYLWRIDFSQYTGARFRVWDDLTAVAAPVYDQTNTTSLPAAKTRQWKPCVRYYSTTSNTKYISLAGMAHRINRPSAPVNMFKW